MWAFNDKSNRPVCLIPETTAIIQEIFRNTWIKTEKLPLKIFYISRCYRYDRPQYGRYREFTQFGVEILGGKDNYTEEIILLLRDCLDQFNIDYNINTSVKRGLSYYIENGFEAECASLGSQKQIAGGGKYSEGIGWAIGVDRLRLALK